MTESILTCKIRRLPPEARKLVERFVDFLFERTRVERRSEEAGGVSASPFFGIWKDRADMSDSSRWVRGVRDSEWPKR